MTHNTDNMFFGIDNLAHPPFDSDLHQQFKQHAHKGSSLIEMELTAVTSTQNIILVDLSNTSSSYNHINTGYIHLEHIDAQVDSTNQGNYIIRVGYLSNITNSHGTFVPVARYSGSKTAGNQITEFINPYPNGARCRPSGILSNAVDTDNSAYNTTTQLLSMTNTNSIDTIPGSGDLIVEITMAAGEINPSLNIAYHTH